jgi:2-(1,2-epoxy-1,2-dihydrophenyl)acetyl-CoA isomerase
MTDAAVICERKGRVAVLRLNRPDVDNTLSADVLDDLRRHIGDLRHDRQVRAAVLTGAGTNFSLGGDFGEFKEALSHDEGFGRSYCANRTTALAEVIAGLYDLPFPVIAAVNGQVAGAGFSLSLACDLRIAEKRTRFHFAYGALGASTDGGMSWLLPRVVGQGRAMKLLLEQPIIRAQKALDLGLITEIVPAAELCERAVAIALHLATNAAHANRSAKRLLRVSEFSSLTDHMRDEHETFAEGLMSADMRRALDARTRGELPTFD